MADIAIALIAPMRTEMAKILSDTDYIDNILRDGAGRADEIARPIMRKTYDIMGFL